MSNSANTPQDPTADYRKYPKGPNFLLIVILAAVVLVVLLVVAVVVVDRKGKTMEPHPPNPTPNSLVQPLLPSPGSQRLT